MASHLIYSTELDCVDQTLLKLVFSRWEARRVLKELLDLFTDGRAHDSTVSVFLHGNFVSEKSSALRDEFLEQIPESLRADVRDIYASNATLLKVVEKLTQASKEHELLYKQQRERAEAAEAELRKITSGECTAD